MFQCVSGGGDTVSVLWSSARLGVPLAVNTSPGVEARGGAGAEGPARLDGAAALHHHRPPADGALPAGQQRRRQREVSSPPLREGEGVRVSVGRDL